MNASHFWWKWNQFAIRKRNLYPILFVCLYILSMHHSCHICQHWIVHKKCKWHCQKNCSTAHNISHISISSIFIFSHAKVSYSFVYTYVWIMGMASMQRTKIYLKILLTSFVHLEFGKIKAIYEKHEEIHTSNSQQFNVCLVNLCSKIVASSTSHRTLENSLRFHRVIHFVYVFDLKCIISIFGHRSLHE